MVSDNQRRGPESRAAANDRMGSQHPLRAGRDVHYLGTRMREWMDHDVQERLEECSATFGGDSCGALLKTIDLFSDLAGSVAPGAHLNDFHHSAVFEEVRRILVLAA